MVDEQEEQSSESFDFHKYVGLVRRRYLYFLVPFFFGWAAVWAASWILPPRYQSNTLILVEQPTMPKDYVTPNVNDDLQERLQSITQQILSRTRLIRIIDQFNLYSSDQRAKISADEKVERMRKDIGIELVRDTSNQISAFNVSYTSRNPRVAQEVTSELTNLFISENLEVRQQQSEDTTQFLETQLEAARKSLADQEDKVRQFKGQHVGEMPTQLASNVQILTGLQSQLQNEEDALNAARQQHVYLQTLSDQYRTLQGSSKSGDGASSSLPALDEQLEKLKAQLADLSSRYTDRHPDVRKVQEQIAKTERLRSQLLASLNKAPTGAADGDVAGTGDPARTSVMAPIQSQLRSNQVEITNREQSIASLKSKIDGYQGRLNQEPIREQQLADLTRGYDQSKANYDDLLKKKNESKMATSMELLQQGERFRIVDPPSYPQKADFPNRLKFCAIGIGLGLALGVVVAGVFEKLDDRMHNAAEIRKLFPASILVEIPEIVNISDAARARRQAVLRWATATMVFAVMLVGSAFSYFRG
jgi:succinoglycan biosynthesis transport protein ExoP